MESKKLYRENKTGKVLFEAAILIMIINFLCAVGIWQSVSNGWKVAGESKVFLQAFVESGGRYAVTYLNQESVYLSFLSVIFSFLGNKEEVVSIINLILQIVGVIFFYLGGKKLYGYAGALVVSALSAILSVCFYPVSADNSMHMIWFLAGFFFWICNKVYIDISGMYLKHILAGILLGISCYVDTIACFFVLAYVLFIFIAKDFSLKEKVLQILAFFMCIVNSFFCMFYLWNDFLFDSKLFLYWIQDKIAFITQPTGMKQYISFGILLIISFIFYGISCRRRELDFILVQEDAIEKNVSEDDEIEEDIIDIEELKEAITQDSMAGIEDNQEVVTEVNEVQETTVAEPEVEPEIKKPIKYIENPLPLPKKHVKKEMTYAFEPSADQMHYDLNNYSVDDDYDLKNNV